MELFGVVGVMLLLGLALGAIAGWIWKRERPYGLWGDLLIGATTAVFVGLIDWFIIPALGYGQRLVYLALVFEPPLAVLLVLWLIRRGKE